VYAPKNPVPANKVTETGINSFPINIPIKNDPVIFTINVPSGNNLFLVKVRFTQYLVIAPKNPPNPTNHIWLSIICLYTPLLSHLVSEKPKYTNK